MKTLLHICCAPCSVACIDSLRAEGAAVTGFWYNHNIHPYQEYKARRDTLVEYSKAIGMPLELRDEYGIKKFTRQVAAHLDARCPDCYRERLEAAAAAAAAGGFECFTTTLLISPYQNHELLQQMGRQAAEQHGVEFLYRDFRPRFREGQQMAREMGMYMQKYCGCVFSEAERYDKEMKRTGCSNG